MLTSFRLPSPRGFSQTRSHAHNPIDPATSTSAVKFQADTPCASSQSRAMWSESASKHFDSANDSTKSAGSDVEELQGVKQVSSLLSKIEAAARRP